jgi:hypothetical protein
VNSEPATDLEKVLQDSKVSLETEIKEKKRGRPKGSTTAASTIKPTQTKVSPETYKQMLAAVIGFTGEFLATGSKFEGFKFSPQEIELLSTQGSEVCAEFLPQIDSKYVKLGAFTLSVVSIYGMKYYAYNEHYQKIKKQEQSKEFKAEDSVMNFRRDFDEIQAN